MLSTDGVGTNLELARRSNRWEGVGIDFAAWRPPPIFQGWPSGGDIPAGEMRGVLNVGIGLCLIAAPDHADGLIELCGYLVIGKIAPANV